MYKTITWKTPGGEYYRISAEALKAEHTLIAGATGCGKSTFLHSIMQAALIKYSPANAQFVLCDPKEVELRQYKDLPHTVTYATEEGDILEALDSVLRIMKERYAYMAKKGQTTWTDGSHIFVIIEELADLMACPLRKYIQIAIQRLTQKGRAAGISVIAATQAPSRKVIPAEITLNFTARFALACESYRESKQVVGIAGAEALPDHGECIYKYKRHIGRYVLPFVTATDVLPLVDYWTGKECRVRRSIFKKAA